MFLSYVFEIVQDSLVSKSLQLRYSDTNKLMQYSGHGFLQRNSSFQDDEFRCQVSSLSISVIPITHQLRMDLFPPQRKSRKTAKHSCSGAVAATRCVLYHGLGCWPCKTWPKDETPSSLQAVRRGFTTGSRCMVESCHGSYLLPWNPQPSAGFVEPKKKPSA